MGHIGTECKLPQEETNEEYEAGQQPTPETKITPESNNRKKEVCWSTTKRKLNQTSFVKSTNNGEREKKKAKRPTKTGE